ncbi:MAG: carbohydrate-binding domain-containing protein [Lachnospiraceae bacterium]|nr:carbohydrate-binding domain-containing protein [Lachnospiraceae bacterium]
MRKKMLAVSMVATLALASVTACSSGKSGIGDETSTNVWDNIVGGDSGTSDEGTTLTKFDIEVNYSEKEQLSVTKAQLSSYSNVIKLADESVTITESGEYVIEGTINDGQIIVDVPETDTEVVTLILNGVDITCSNSAAIYVKSADKVVLSLVEGTVNNLQDGSEYTYDDETEEEPNACVFSKDDLVISGKGTLNVTGKFNNGIASKDDLTITGGIINVEAVNNGIKGKDSIAVMDADVTVNAGADGLKADNTTDTEKGFILIDNGSFKITSGEDAIQAETCMEINGGTFDITTGEGAGTTSWNNGDDWGKPGMGGMSQNSSTSTDTTSIKALKAGCDITVNAGTFTIDSEDDAIHTNVSVEINGGAFDIKSGDDGVHADNTLIINGGDINITQCYEGIEATYITMNDGDVHVVSSDDGFNAAGGNDASAMGGRPGMNGFSEGTGSLSINGGYVYIDATGDGLDANGSFEMTEGYVIVDGPSNSGNGAFDYGSSCNVTGGFIVAVGASGMSQMPSQASINCVMIGLSENISSGTLVNISDSDGNTVLTFEGAKSYNNMVLCTSDLKTGETYTVKTGGSVTGTATDGVYTGAYSGGTEALAFTVENTLTTAGNANGGMGGMGGMKPGGNKGDGGFGGGRH